MAPSISPTPICFDIKGFKGKDAIENIFLTCEKLMKKNNIDKTKFCNRDTTYLGETKRVYYFCPETCGYDCSPTQLPTYMPSMSPSKLPSMDPSKLPSMNPNKLPSKDPSKLPSMDPSKLPSMDPSKLPSMNP